MLQLETVGEIVRILRGRRGLDQIDLARACGWRDASAVSRIETDRIHPTRRTLTKLAESLSGPETLPVDQVRALLFCAAGVLPTKDDVDRMRASMHMVDSWGFPAYISDFSWNVWHANPACVEMLGLPNNHRGRNLLDMYFEDGSCRHRAGDGWSDSAGRVLTAFRSETARRTQQRWYRALMTKMNAYGDFAPTWERSATGARAPSYRLPLDGDARFSIVPVLDLTPPI